MKILKILNGNDGGGIFTCEKQYISNLRRRGVFVFGVIIGEGNSYKDYKEIVDDYIEIPALNTDFSGSTRAIFKNIKTAYKYGKEQSNKILFKITNHNFDAIFYRRVPFLFLVGLIGKKIEKPTFWHMPNIVNNFKSYIFYNIFLRLFEIQPVGNSKYTQKTMGNLCQNVLYPGYSPERVANGEPKYRKKLKIANEAPVYGVIARIDPQKAQDLVVRAFIRSNVYAQGGHLLLAGGYKDPGYFEKVKKAAGDSYGKQVHYIGKISDVNNFFASIDVMINGRINAEPFGISIAESLGAGVPVIAYNLGGPMEMVIQSETGWLVQKSDVKHYTKAINLSLKDKNLWKNMSTKCSVHSQKYTVRNNVSKLIELFKS